MLKNQVLLYSNVRISISLPLLTAAIQTIFFLDRKGSFQIKGVYKAIKTKLAHLLINYNRFSSFPVELYRPLHNTCLYKLHKYTYTSNQYTQLCNISCIYDYITRGTYSFPNFYRCIKPERLGPSRNEEKMNLILLKKPKLLNECIFSLKINSHYQSNGPLTL